jgi:O-antigen ligase
MTEQLTRPAQSGLRTPGWLDALSRVRRRNIRKQQGSRSLPRKFPAVIFVIVYAVLLICIPSQLVLGSLGAAGTPANMWGIAALLWWVCSTLAGMSHTRGFTPIRIVIGLLALSVASSYISGTIRGWFAPADVRQITDELWTLLPVTLEDLTSTMIKAADRGLLSFAGWAGIALLTADGLKSWKDLHRLATWVSWLGTFLAGLGIVQYFTKLDIAGFFRFPGLVANSDFGMVDSRSILNRVSGTAVHPIEYGVVLAAIFPLALHYGFTHRGKMTAWVPTIVIGVGAPMAISRSGVLALMAASLVLLLGWSGSRRRRALILAPIAAVALRLAIPGLLGTIVSLFTNFFNDPSISGRTQDYGVVFGVFADNPWFGRGLFTFVPRYYRILDNQYLVTLVELGIIGLTALILFFVVGVFTALGARRRAMLAGDKDIALALAASLVGLAGSYATFDAWGFPMAAGITFLVVGMIGAAWQNSVRDAKAPTMSRRQGTAPSPGHRKHNGRS